MTVSKELKIGQRVKLKFDVLQRHSRSVPASSGFTREQFNWRNTLDSLGSRTGKIQRLFPNSSNVNVQFGKTLIGINKDELMLLSKKRGRK